MAATDQENQESQVMKEKFETANEPEPKEVVKESPEDDIEKVVPQKEWNFVADYDIKLKDEDIHQHFERTYIQKPLSYHAMIEFTGLLTRKLDEAMSGPEGLSLDKILPDEKLPLTFIDGQLSVVPTEGLEGIDSLLRSALRIFSYIPEFLVEAQCIWLRIPRNERPLVMDIWSKPVDEGGMSMSEGEEMLTLFIEQNYEELEYFLKKLWKNILKSVQRSKQRKQQES